MECRVVKVDVQATVAGEYLNVSAATVTLGVNAIPQIELLCAPTLGAKASPLRPYVSRPTITEYADLYERLSDKAEGKIEPGYVTMTINVNDGAEHEVINLNNWILVDVGMSSVSATAAPNLIVILQHPICKLTKVGSIYETPKSDFNTKLKKAINPGPFTTIVRDVYNFVKNDVLFWPTANGIPPIYRHKLAEQEHLPSTYLEDKTEKVFLQSYIVGAEKRMAEAEARIALPDGNNTSTWDMLLKATGLLLISITQDQSHNFTTDKLLLEPTQPWQERTITLEEDWCFSTELVGRDPYKLAGVMVRKLGPYTDEVNLGILKNGNVKINDPYMEVMYVPEPYKDPDKADGRIMKTSAPQLLDQCFREDAPFGGEISAAQCQLVEARVNTYDAALEAYAHTVYDITACSMARSVANMALYFKDVSGNLILPGNTCSFQADGKELYYGYIEKVVHHLSVQGGNQTSITMSHVRPKPSYMRDKQTIIPINEPNVAYNYKRS